MKKNKVNNENKNKIIEDFLDKLNGKEESDDGYNNVKEYQEEDSFEKAEREYRKKNVKTNINKTNIDDDINIKSQEIEEKPKDNFNTNKNKAMMKIFLNSIYNKNGGQSSKPKQKKIFNKTIKPIKIPNPCVNFKNSLLNICTNDQILQFYAKKIKKIDTSFPKNLYREKRAQYELSTENNTEKSLLSKTKTSCFNSPKHGMNVGSPYKKFLLKNKSYYSVQRTKNNFSNPGSLKKEKNRSFLKSSNGKIKVDYNYNNFLQRQIELISTPKNNNNNNKKPRKVNLIKYMNDHNNPFSTEWSNYLLNKNNLQIHFNDFERGVPFLRIKKVKNEINFPFIVKNIKEISKFNNKRRNIFDEEERVYFNTNEKILNETTKQKMNNYRTPGHGKRNNL